MHDEGISLCIRESWNRLQSICQYFLLLMVAKSLGVGNILCGGMEDCHVEQGVHSAILENRVSFLLKDRCLNNSFTKCEFEVKILFFHL